jgi:hypothetical protein
MTLRRISAVVAIASGIVVLGAGPALACGGLVGENGTIQLTRTATLAAYQDGVEHYVTSFEFTGQGEEVGSIVPLPGVPTAVERGGDWTLQRLQIEVAPPANEFGAAALAASDRSAQVLLETKIDALEITILKGGGDEVGTWAIDHGFLLTPDAPEVLDFYASRSPIFMAARFDATTAADLGQNSGDGTPIQLTIPTDEPWVPLRILSLGLEGSKFVDADVFLLTDGQPQLLAGGPGLTVERSEQASDFLLDDLRSDAGTTWVPQQAWFTYLRLGVDARSLDYDLAISTRPEQPPSTVAAGIDITGDTPVVVPPVVAGDPGAPVWPWVLAASAAGLALLGGVAAIGLRRADEAGTRVSGGAHSR